jgi:hypothetical protein
VKKSVEVEGECTFYGACRYDRRDFLFQVRRTVVIIDFFFLVCRFFSLLKGTYASSLIVYAVPK